MRQTTFLMHPVAPPSSLVMTSDGHGGTLINDVPERAAVRPSLGDRLALRLRFDTYNVNVVIISDTDEEEVREMFLRLQNGTLLKVQTGGASGSGDHRHRLFRVTIASIKPTAHDEGLHRRLRQLRHQAASAAK